MTLSKHLTLLFLLILIKSDADGSVIVKRDNNENVQNETVSGGSGFEKSLFGGPEERNLEREIIQELNHLSSRKQREIFDDLEKQNENFNVSRKSLVLSETDNLSPLNLEELKNIRKTIKTSNSTLPAIRNKRTLSFLLSMVARAMGYRLTPTNPDAEWIPRQQQPSAQPCSTPPPPCRPNPPSTPPPCATPPTTPPCPGSNALTQPATIPPNQIDANTISYPYRPARTIPLFNFAPLPAGVRVPYPPLFQPPAQQRTPCTPQQPSPPPCNATPAPSPPPCGTTPAPKAPPPCMTTPAPPPPCGTTPAPSPPPCATTPAPSPPPCNSTPTPPCGTTPAPKPPPCMTTPAPPPPCGKTPAPSPPPCSTPAPPCTTPAPSPPPCSTPAPPCTTPAPSPPPCSTPAPPCTTPAPSPPPCSTPAPPCTTPAPSPPPCSSPAPPPPPPPPPSNPPKKGSILLEYDDPVRIQIFSNEKKYLPASGNIFSGHDDEHKEDLDSYFYPANEKNSKKDEDFEENEEMEEEHIEEEEETDAEAPGQLKHYEEEDERTLADNKEEEEEDESETNLSIIKKPIDQDIKKTQKRLITTKTKTDFNDKESSKFEKEEKSQKAKKPKRKKWIRIVKKQRRKTKMDSNPQNNYQIYTSDSFPQASGISRKFYTRKQPPTAFDSYEKNTSDYSDDSSSLSSEDVSRIDLKKVIVNKKELTSPGNARGYEFNFNPYALEPEDQRRKKLEKVVEKYVEDYVEKQLGDELIKNTGVPKTTVFEFAPKNGPKIQTITTTVAKTTGKPNYKPHNKPDSYSQYNNPTRNFHFVQNTNHDDNLKKRGNISYQTFTIHK